MHINNIAASKWGASLNERLIKPAGTEANTQRNKVLSYEKAAKRIYIKILFQGSNRDQIEKNISNFSMQLQKEFILKVPNKNTFFKCLPSQLTIEDTNFNTMMYAAGEFDCIEYEEEREIIIEDVKEKSFTVGGNCEAFCILELIPKADLIEATITGLSEKPILVRNLKGGKSFLINGETGNVTLDGSNYYRNYHAWEFPRVKAGENTVSIDKDNIVMKIRYKAQWN